MNQPIWKICSSNWIISPRIRVENKKYLSCHHPEEYCWLSTKTVVFTSFTWQIRSHVIRFRRSHFSSHGRSLFWLTRTNQTPMALEWGGLTLLMTISHFKCEDVSIQQDLVRKCCLLYNVLPTCVYIGFLLYDGLVCLEKPPSTDTPSTHLVHTPPRVAALRIKFIMDCWGPRDRKRQLRRTPNDIFPSKISCQTRNGNWSILGLKG